MKGGLGFSSEPKEPKQELDQKIYKFPRTVPRPHSLWRGARA
jgi:hypothetical protein